MKGRSMRLIGAASTATMLMIAGSAQAGVVDAVLGEWDFDLDYGGFVRNETAFKITGDENPYNQRGNIFNNVPVERSGAPLNLGIGLVNDTAVRAVPEADNTINMEYLRGELNVNLKLFSNLSFEMSVRGIADPDLYENYDPGSVRTADPVGPLQQHPNLFEYRYDSVPSRFPGRRNTDIASEPGGANEAALARNLQAEKGSSPLEWAGDEYMVDLPKFYFEYQNGPLFIRAGNQQIAWGDLLFFRIMDVANGLDLRRHQLLDFVPEEFSDKRIPSLGVRGSYSLPRGLPVVGGWELDAYVQRFRPTIYPNPNTPYNVIPAQFTVHDQFKQYDDEFNYGLRLRGRIGPVDVTLMANRRYNHWGVFQWTDSDVAQGLQPGGPAGLVPGLRALNNVPIVGDAIGDLLGDLTRDLTVPITGSVLADTIFEVDPTGVTSAREFYTYGAMARLNHFTALNTGIREFPAAQQLAAVEANNAAQQEQQEDLFLQASGGLRGHIRREYFRENNFGLSLGYRIEGPQDSLLFNQINASLEAKYTPERAFTPLDLNPYKDNVIREDEYELGLVFQKFIRYSAGFPAMFAVLQYLHRSESDIFNRHLSGFGGDPSADNPSDRLPQGIGSFNAVALAIQQPFPNRIWRIDFAALYDVQGGLLVQPALRWKPNSDWTLQVFANVIETVHGNEFDNALSTVDFADEITTRITYQF